MSGAAMEAAHAASGSLLTALPWVAVAFSALAVVTSGVVRWGEARKARDELATGRRVADRLSGEYEGLKNGLPGLRTVLAGLREMLARLEKDQIAGASTVDADDSFVVDPEVKRFMDLVMAWKKETGHRLRGTAISDWSTIEALTIPDLREQDVAESKAIFAVAARRVVEYAVVAAGTPVATEDEEQVGKLLEEMAGLVGLELIAPQRGQRPDLNLHESVNTVPADRNQPGTIAKVEVRGLVRSNGSVMKAKVYLYD